jgi:predicted DNA binding CopG/RHH family protein
MNKYNTKYIDKEERDLVEGIKRLKTKNLPLPTQKEQRALRLAAKKYIEKETKMNIRIDQSELNRIKKEAEKEGLKYQTYIKSILHKFITGQLVEKVER